jgi:hypothetical protein
MKENQGKHHKIVVPAWCSCQKRKLYTQTIFNKWDQNLVYKPQLLDLEMDGEK